MKKTLTFSHKLAITIGAFYIGFTSAMAALICLFPDVSTPLLTLTGIVITVPNGVLLSYYKKARIENIEKIKNNPLPNVEDEEGGDI